MSFEDLGSFAKVLQLRGYEVRQLLAGRDSLAPANLGDPDLSIVLGGPISVNDTELYPFIEHELEFLADRLKRQRPTLGICLGAQLMSKALGGGVHVMTQKEIGWSRLELTRSQPPVLAALSDVPVLHWHGEQFSIPPSARLLASTGLCPHQAFAVGNFGLGLQFHPEVTRQGLELWYVGHCAELSHAGLDIRQLRADAERHAEVLEVKARSMLETWLEQCEA